jgi:hypothetical protein
MTMKNELHTQHEPAGAPDRRALLRTGGAVVAGMAALAVAETALADSASAAAGGPVVMGAANTADATSTTLTSSSGTAPTLAVANTGTFAPLRVTEQAIPATLPSLGSGDVANYGGDLYYTAGGTNGPFFGFVYTEWTASQVVPIIPTRVLDTRISSGRVNILNASGNLDSAGRLLGGHAIAVDLFGLEVGAVAAFCNLTAVAPLAGGFLTLWAGGTRPGTSSVNYPAQGVVANFAVTGVSDVDSVSIFASKTTHVLLDITAFSVGNAAAQLDPAILPAAAASPSQRLAARARSGGKLPSWAVRR